MWRGASRGFINASTSRSSGVTDSLGSVSGLRLYGFDVQLGGLSIEVYRSKKETMIYGPTVSVLFTRKIVLV